MRFTHFRTEENAFVPATKLGTTNNFFVAATKHFAAGTKHFVVVTVFFCCPYFNKLFSWYNKTFYTVRGFNLLSFRVLNHI